MAHPNPDHNGDPGHRAPSISAGGPALEADLQGLIAEVHATAANRLASLLGPGRLLAGGEDDHAQIWAVIAEAVTAAERRRVLARQPALGPQTLEHVTQAVYDALLRLGPLQRYLADPRVEELIVNGHARAFVIRTGGHKHEITTGFSTEAQVRAFAARIVAGLGRRLDEAAPAVDVRLADGSRMHVITPPLATATHITIRRHRLIATTLGELITLGTLTPPVAELLRAAVAARLNLLICGGTAAGKTTLLNALAAQIPPAERVITIEHTAELQLAAHLPDCPSLQARLANTEGVGEVSQRELLYHALRMRPSRIVLGEARGGEALDMLGAMASGHPGSMGTLHADGTRQALRRLRVLARTGDTGLSSEVISEMIAETIDWVVHLRAGDDGRRVVAEVAEVAGLDGAQFLTNRLVTLDEDGRPVPTGLRSRHAEGLHAVGWLGGQGAG